MYMFWNINLKLGLYINWAAPHIGLEFHHNQVTLTYLTAKNGPKQFFFIYGLNIYIEPSELVHTLK